jgi:hypothetical protein
MSHIFVSRVGVGEQESWLRRGKHEMYEVFGQESSWGNVHLEYCVIKIRIIPRPMS